MIPIRILENSKKHIPWKSNAMVEQDLILSKALISLYANEVISNQLVFRGGTALNKLYLNPPARYSEDIDFVQQKAQPIGSVIDAIRTSLAWLGKPKVKFSTRSVKALYAYTNIDGHTGKLKLEINTTEHFHVEALQTKSFSFTSNWAAGSSKIITYSLSELMATKLRALHQRRKGRDLFDIWYVLSRKMVDTQKVTYIFHQYNRYNGIRITPSMFAQSLAEKKANTDFQHDTQALLPHEATWDFNTAFDYVMQHVVPFI